jgi:hypothetical protein
VCRCTDGASQESLDSRAHTAILRVPECATSGGAIRGDGPSLREREDLAAAVEPPRDADERADDRRVVVLLPRDAELGLRVADDRPLAARGALGLPRRPVDDLEDEPRVLGQRPARRGELDLTTGAIEEQDAQLVLERLDLPARRRLRDAQP